MSRVVSTLLEQRFEELQTESRRAGIAFSLVVHFGLIATAWFLSTLQPRTLPFDEFSPVRLVPVAALGSTTAPREQTPTAPAQSEPEPEPVVVEDAPPDPTPVPQETRSEPVKPQPAQPQQRPATDRTASASQQRRGTPGGSRLGTSLAGSASASLDAPDFTYSYYTDQLLAQIDSVWNRPVIGGNIEAVVQFVIRRDGSLADVRLGRSSGYNSFDLAAMRAIRAAAPFPPLPAAFKGSTLGVNLTVR